MDTQHNNRLRRASWSLEGLSVGDAFGQIYETIRRHIQDAVQQDDMTLLIMKVEEEG